MSNEAITWAFNLPLAPGPKFVLVALADYADEAHSCFPSVARLSQRTGYGQTAVRGHLARLVELELVSFEQRTRPDGGDTSKRFTLHVGATVAEEAEPTDPPTESEGPPPQNPKGPPTESEGAPRQNPEGPPYGIRGGKKNPHFNPQDEPPHDPGALAPSAAPDLVLEAFETVWRAWPRREGRKVALLKFRAAAKRAKLPTIVAAALDHCSAWAEWPAADRQFVPHLSTWLNQDRWENPRPEPRTTATKPTARDKMAEAAAELARRQAQTPRGITA